MRAACRGFTLIEMAVVLVIIALVSGGIIIGRDMIEAATLRQQLRQIEDIRAGVGAFRARYHYLPGDLPAVEAAALGFTPRAGTRGRGDGNGVLETCDCNFDPQDCPEFPMGCELFLVWADLGRTAMIDANFAEVSDAYVNAANFEQVTRFAPRMRLPNHVLMTTRCADGGALAAANIRQMTQSAGGGLIGFSGQRLRTRDAQVMDVKIDDGRPGSGRVLVRSSESTDWTENGLGYFCKTPAAGSCYTTAGEYGTSQALDFACFLTFRGVM